MAPREHRPIELPRGARRACTSPQGHGIDLNVSYARSSARGDLNSLANYFDAMMWPIIGQNAYAPANADVPNRLLARGRAMPTDRWLVIGIFDWRSGLPYSVVDENARFRRAQERGPPLSGLCPHRARRSSTASRSFTISRGSAFAPTMRSDVFLPTDVQANLASPAFGTFYNSEYRQFRIQVRFER